MPVTDGPASLGDFITDGNPEYGHNDRQGGDGPGEPGAAASCSSTGCGRGVGVGRWSAHLAQGVIDLDPRS